jgi:uncharacterized protein YcnI
MVRKKCRRIGAVLGAAAAAVIGTALPAAAHVTVNPQEATQGGYAKVAFRVPNERDVATTKLEIALPEGQPVASVSTRPVAGWTVKVTKAKLAKPIKREDGEVTEAVSRIEWTADNKDAQVQAGEFQEFEVSMGPLPSDSDQMIFKALQTYADGQIVRWIEEPSGSTEPEHPAPVLKLAKAASDGHHGETSKADGAAKGDEQGHSGSHGASWPGYAGLAAGLAGLVLGAVALLRTRRRT